MAGADRLLISQQMRSSPHLLAFRLLLPASIVIGAGLFARWVYVLPDNPAYEGVFKPIRGVVVDERGAPVAGALVVASLHISTTTLFYVSDQCRSAELTRTDSMGRFEISSASSHIALGELVKRSLFFGVQVTNLVSVAAPARFQEPSPRYVWLTEYPFEFGGDETDDAIRTRIVAKTIASPADVEKSFAANSMLLQLLGPCQSSEPIAESVRNALVPETVKSVCALDPSVPISAGNAKDFTGITRKLVEGRNDDLRPYNQAIERNSATAGMLCAAVSDP